MIPQIGSVLDESNKGGFLMDARVLDLLVNIVRDLEDTRIEIQGYSYVRTIRNILIGKQEAVIAPNFKGKPYYGVLKSLTLEETESLLDAAVNANKLICDYRAHGKLYCTIEYYNLNFQRN